MATGDYQTAIRSLHNAASDESITLDPALVYRKTGMVKEAAQTLSEGLRAYPGDDTLAPLPGRGNHCGH